MLLVPFSGVVGRMVYLAHTVSVKQMMVSATVSWGHQVPSEAVVCIMTWSPVQGGSQMLRHY